MGLAIMTSMAARFGNVVIPEMDTKYHHYETCFIYLPISTNRCILLKYRDYTL